MERLVMLATGLTINFCKSMPGWKKGGSCSGPILDGASDEQAFFIVALSDNKCTENE